MRTTHEEVDLDLVVAEVDEPADRVRTLALRRADGQSLPRWSAGAHIDLRLGPDVVRQYSLYGDPADRTTWRVAVLLEEESRGGSTYVHERLRVGSTVAGRGPRNHFPVCEATDYLFVAGGIGITPLLPMIRQVDDSGAGWRLVYGGRRRSAMAFADDLVRRYGDRVDLVPEDQLGPLPVVELMSGTHAGTAVYCCGPESLIRAVEAAHGGAPQLHVERFSPRESDEPATAATFEVEASRSGIVVTVGPDTSLLEALRSAGVHLLSSCEEGLCGTCELAVLAGRPDHRDSILTGEERAAGATMFVCVSRSLTPRLVLDV